MKDVDDRKDVASVPVRWRELTPEGLSPGEPDLDARVASMVRQIGEPTLPSAATMDAVRARIALRRGPGPRTHRGLIWAMAVFALICSVTLGAAAHGWITRRWASPPSRPPEADVPTKPAPPRPNARHRAAPDPAALEAPSVEESPVLPPPKAPLPVAQQPAVAVPKVSPPEVPSRSARQRTESPPARPPRPHPGVKLASVSPPPFPSQSTSARDDGPSESQVIVIALKKLRQNHDARGALEALDRHRAAFPNGHLGTEAELIRVEALLALGERAAALRWLDENAAIGQSPRSRELLVLRGELRASANRCSEAVGDLGRTISVTPVDSLDERALFARASCLSRLHQFAAARRDLEQYLARFPRGAHAGSAAAILQSLQ